MNQVMDRSDIVSIISAYTKLKANGSNYKGLCPFHQEKTPSFSVNAAQQLYYCFGCGRGGTVVTFVQEKENLDFPAAVEYLADKAGLSMPKSSSNSRDTRADTAKQIAAINTEVAKYYHERLNENATAMDYLLQRGLSPSTIRRFGLGYSPNAPISEALGIYNNEELLEAGLVGVSGDNDSKRRYYNRFRDRVIFPIIDMRKRVMGFGGRAIGDGTPKYLNSPDTPLFDKSQNLYGINFAKASKQDFFILVEGYMDVISLHQAGFIEAVATLGTSLTKQQAELIRKLKQNVIIAYDCDEAGKKATMRAIEILIEVGLNALVVQVHPYKDPDEYIKAKGRQAFIELLANAATHIEYKIDRIRETYNIGTTDGKIRYISEVAAIIATIASPIQREIYITKVSATGIISADALANEIARSKRGIAAEKALPKTMAVAKGSTSSVAEHGLINLICYHDDLIPAVRDKIKADYFADSEIGAAYDSLLQMHEKGEQFELRQFIMTCPHPQINRILHTQQNFDDIDKALRDFTTILQRNYKARKRANALQSDADIMDKASKLNAFM